MAVPEKSLSALFCVEGGMADQSILPAYDVGQMLVGIARASNIIAHAFSKNDEIRKRAEAANEVETLVSPSRKGCFEEEITFRFSPKLVGRMGASVIANGFWDYYGYAWSSAVGYEYVPRTPFLTRRLAANELLGQEMAEALETALQEVHRPIHTDRNLKIEVIRPRVGVAFSLDATTMDYIATREDVKNKLTIIGNVTRFNILSGFGRVFVSTEKRVVPFRIVDNRDDGLMKQAVASMNDSLVDNFRKGKRRFTVHKIESANGQLKRYVVHEIA